MFLIFCLTMDGWSWFGWDLISQDDFWKCRLFTKDKKNHLYISENTQDGELDIHEVL